MDTTGVVLLGLIALASLVQSAVLLALLVGGRRLARRAGDVGARFEREIRPALDDAARITRNVGEVADRAAAQARRVDAMVDRTSARLRDATGRVADVLKPAVGQAGATIAVARGLGLGLSVLRRLRRRR